MRITSNIEEVIKGFSDLEKKQIPYMQMLTVNNIAFDAMQSARTDVKNRFNGKSLAGAIRVKKATNKKNPYALVYVDDYVAWKENALTTLGLGGSRSTKSMEKAMQKAGLLRSTEIIIEDGKVQPWVYVQLMSILQLNWKAGYSANQTKASKKRKDAAIDKASKAESKFFVVTSSRFAISRNLGKVKKKKTGLAPGIYARMGNSANNQQVFRLFKIARKANYKQQWDLKEIIFKVYERRGSEHFSKAYEIAMWSAK